MQFSSTRTKKLVDLTPMVSVIFLLIIFFLVAGTIRSPAFWDIELSTSNSKDHANPQMLNIYLSQKGEFAYEQQTINLSQLQQILKDKTSDAIIQVHADFRVDSLKLIQLLDSMQSTTINRVVLVTKSKH